jgi:O-antigen/teichoic acid export membrane protein
VNPENPQAANRPDTVSATGTRILIGSAGQMAVRVLNMAALLFTSRLIGPSGLGSYGLVIAYIGAFSILSGLGVPTAHLKRISEGKDLGRCNGTFFAIRFVQISLVVLTVLCAYGFQKYLLGHGFESSSLEMLLLVLLLSRFLADLGQSLNYTFSARRETVKQWIPIVIGVAVDDALYILIALAAPSVVLLAWADVAMNLVILIGYLVLFRGYPLLKPTLEYFKLYATFAGPVLLIGMIETLYGVVDSLFVGFRGGTTELGLFLGATSIASIVGIIQVALGGLIFPTMSHNLRIGAVDRVHQLASTLDKVLVTFFIPALLLTWLFQEQIVVLVLGTAYRSSSVILVVLTAMVMVKALYTVYAGLLMARGELKRVLLIVAGSFVFYSLGNLLILKFYPARNVGVAIAFLKLATELFLFTAYRLNTRALIPFKGLLILLPHITIGFVLGLVSKLLISSIPSSPLNTILISTAVIVLYFGFLLATRGWSLADWRGLWQLARPSALKRYILFELAQKPGKVME